MTWRFGPAGPGRLILQMLCEGTRSLSVPVTCLWCHVCCLDALTALLSHFECVLILNNAFPSDHQNIPNRAKITLFFSYSMTPWAHTKFVFQCFWSLKAIDVLFSSMFWKKTLYFCSILHFKVIDFVKYDMTVCASRATQAFISQMSCAGARTLLIPETCLCCQLLCLNALTALLSQFECVFETNARGLGWT